METVVKNVEKDWSSWPYIMDRIYIMNPSGYNSQKCIFNHKKEKYALLTCEQQNVKDCIKDKVEPVEYFEFPTSLKLFKHSIPVIVYILGFLLLISLIIVFLSK